MIKIRAGVFETNSSSSHSLVIGKPEEIKKFENGESLYIEDSYGLPDNFDKYDQLISKEDLLKELPSLIEEDEELKEMFHGELDSDVLEHLYEEYNIADIDMLSEYKESFNYDYTTEHGDKIAIICFTGYDG